MSTATNVKYPPEVIHLPDLALTAFTPALSDKTAVRRVRGRINTLYKPSGGKRGDGGRWALQNGSFIDEASGHEVPFMLKDRLERDFLDNLSMRGGYIEFVASRPQDILWTKQEPLRDGTDPKHPFKLEIKPSAVFHGALTNQQYQSPLVEQTPELPLAPAPRETVNPPAVETKPTPAAVVSPSAPIPFPTASAQVPTASVPVPLSSKTNDVSHALVRYVQVFDPVAKEVNRLWTEKPELFAVHTPEVYSGVLALFFNRAMAEGVVVAPPPKVPESTARDRYARLVEGVEFKAELILRLNGLLGEKQPVKELTDAELEAILANEEFNEQLARTKTKRAS
jgi:hypothetical protein